MPVIFRYDLDCGRRGTATSFIPIPSMDLMYLSMIEKSLGAGTLLVVMIMLWVAGLMNSALKVDFIPLSIPLITLTCIPALFMIEVMCWPKMGTIACFLDGPLVVVTIFFFFLGCELFSVALWISIIFLLGRAGNASLSLSMSLAEEET